MNNGTNIIDQEMLLEAFADGFDDEDDFGDDIDMDQLVEVADTVEQTHAVGQISFVPTNDETTPPPLLPSNIPCPHKFNPEELRTWIYPTNYPVRGYQLNIVKNAMFTNTLVALPTGLGKTFIAAVVMYNYWRWFPDSKIIFMAHSRPLVDQQIEACFTICGIPQDETAEITGVSKTDKRRELWSSKRVFFATPQTVRNDLISKACPAHLISCIVLDEAHKATGNYAFTEVIHKVNKINKHFRVLALTATPGSRIDTVQAVVSNLHISRIEIRTEQSMDIQQYSFGKNIQRIVVKLGYTEGSTGMLPRILSDYTAKVFEPILLDLSKKPTDVSPDVSRATPYGLMASRQRFMQNSKNLPGHFRFAIISQYLVAESACRAYEYLSLLGIRPFIDNIEQTLEEFKAKDKMNGTQRAFANNSALDGILRLAKQETRKPDFIGHPKMDHLLSILLGHFSSLQDGEVSKVMIFSSFRSSVLDISKVLNRHSPIIRSTIFVGQASDKQGTKGLNQREQQEVLSKFKSDEYNVLVATSIGEEGLDIGEIDLIICYDSQSSPIRMLQRMGRTGRKRQGKCILLHTEAEENKFNKAKQTYALIQKQITAPGNITYYKPEPQILPANYKPIMVRKELIIGVYQKKAISKKRTRTAENVENTLDGLLKPEVERSFIQSFCNQNQNYTNLHQILGKFWPTEKNVANISKFIPLQGQLQTTYRVGHSKRTLQLSTLVEKMEYRIMHPDEKIKIKAPKQQTLLKMPTKFSKNKLTMPKPRKRRQISERLDQDDFDDFMQNSNVEQFADLPPDDTDQEPPKPKKADKGKSKMSLSQELREMNAITDMEDENTDEPSWEKEPRSWEPMLPDSVFADMEPLPDSRHASHNNNSSALLRSSTPPDITHRSPTPQPSNPPQSQKFRSNTSQQTDFGDDFDFSFDASFIEQADALVQAKIEPGFDNSLEAKFDFEKPTGVPGKKKAVTLIWPGAPPFSQKGLKLLEERQKRLEAKTGHRIIMQFQANKNAQHVVPQKKPQQQQQPAQAQAQAQAQALQKPTTNTTTAVPPTTEDLNDNNEFDDLDLDEGLFANFLENKIDDDGYYAENFMYGQDEKSTQNIAEKSILHAEVSTQIAKQNATAVSSSKASDHLSSKPVNTKRQYQQLGDTISQDDMIEFDLDELNALSSSEEEEQEESNGKQTTPAALRKQPSIVSIEDSQEVLSQANLDVPEEVSPVLYRSRKKRIIDQEEPESPSLLSALSKGLYTPSPLRPTRDSPSPIAFRRRLKRRIIEDDDEEDDIDDEQMSPPKALIDVSRKRLKRKISNEDEEDFVVLPTSQHELNKRLMQTRHPKPKKHHKDHQRHGSYQDEGLENPFIDQEAEFTSDEGHTDEDVDVLFDSSASSVVNSFIDDDDPDSTEPSSLLAGEHAPPILSDDLPRNEKHWMNRFNADKWLNMNMEDDSVVLTDDEAEAVDEESVHGFSSDLKPVLLQDDDDFM